MDPDGLPQTRAQRGALYKNKDEELIQQGALDTETVTKITIMYWVPRFDFGENLSAIDLQMTHLADTTNKIFQNSLIKVKRLS